MDDVCMVCGTAVPHNEVLCGPCESALDRADEEALKNNPKVAGG